MPSLISNFGQTSSSQTNSSHIKDRIAVLEREVKELDDEVYNARRGYGAGDTCTLRAQLARKKVMLKRLREQANPEALPTWHLDGCSGENHRH